MESSNGIQAVFFDIRDTLGVVDRPGHLLKFGPSTDQLLKFAVAAKLKIGLITNLPVNVSSAAGRKMVEDVGIAAWLDPQGFVTNHEAGVEKPNPDIYRFAAKQIGVPVEQCLFVGENLPEVIGAQQAGMKAVLKPFPPGREFLNRPVAPTANGARLFQILLTEEHRTIGRILTVAERVVQKLNADRVAALESAAVWHVIGTLMTLLELPGRLIMRGERPRSCCRWRCRVVCQSRRLSSSKPSTSSLSSSVAGPSWRPRGFSEAIVMQLANCGPVWPRRASWQDRT